MSVLIVHNSIDVFAVTETWLDSSIEDSEIFSYSFPIIIVRNDRNRRGGEVAFLLSPRVKFVFRPDLCEGLFESVWIELYPSTMRSVLFCCVYRPPSQCNFFEKLLAECESAHSHCPRLIILGDVNADLMRPSCPQTKLLLSVMRQFKLVDLVCAPTRVTMCSSSQIDVLMTTDVQCFESTKVFPFSGSYHHLIVSNFYSRGVCVDPPSHRLVIRNFQKLDTATLDELLACDDIWDSVLSAFDDISDCLECFNLIMNGLILDLLVPKSLEFVSGSALGYLMVPLLGHIACMMLLIVGLQNLALHLICHLIELFVTESILCFGLLRLHILVILHLRLRVS